MKIKYAEFYFRNGGTIFLGVNPILDGLLPFGPNPTANLVSEKRELNCA